MKDSSRRHHDRSDHDCDHEPKSEEDLQVSDPADAPREPQDPVKPGGEPAT